MQQILTLRLIAEEIIEKGQCLYNSFVDYTKAFDTVWHDGLWAVLESMGVSTKLIQCIKALYNESHMAIKINGELSQWVHATLGSRQGDPLSPKLFIALLEAVMDKLEQENEGGVIIGKRRIKDLRFADDVDLNYGKEQTRFTKRN